MTRVRDLEGCPLGLIWPGYPRNIFILINERWTMSKGSDRPNQLGPNKWHRWQAAWHGMISVAKCGPMRPFIFSISLFLSPLKLKILKSRRSCGYRPGGEKKKLTPHWWHRDHEFIIDICLRVTDCLFHQTMSHQKIPHDFPAPRLHPPGQSCDKVNHYLIYLKHLSYCDEDAFPNRDGFALTPDTAIWSKITHSIQNRTPARLQVKYRGGVHQRTIGLCRNVTHMHLERLDLQVLDWERTKNTDYYKSKHEISMLLLSILVIVACAHR